MQRFIKYFAMLVFFIVIYYLGNKIVLQFEQTAKTTFNGIPFYVAQVIFSYVLGIVLGLPYMIQEMRKQGTWKYDWSKALAIAIPSLFISLVPLMVMTGLLKMTFLPTSLLKTFPTQLFGIAAFYFLITSFYKSQEITE